MAASLYCPVLKFLFIVCFLIYNINAALLSDSFSDAGKLKKEYANVSMEPGKEISVANEPFKIFCQENVPKSILYTWRSTYVKFVEVPSDYKIYSGENDSIVYQQYISETVWHPTTWMSWRDSSVSFPAFGSYCLGVKSSTPYTLQLVVRNVNYWRIIQLLAGVILFFKAESLSRNPIFHYTTGISMGVLASVLVLLYVIKTFIPKRSMSFAFILISYSLVLYYAQQFYNSLQDFVTTYSTFLSAYIVITAILSFIVCYRFGPVKDKRTVNIIKWCIQASSLLLTFLSTEYREVSTALIIVMISFSVIPSKWMSGIRLIWYRRFPPKRKLLTESEYIEEGTVETRKSLEELRDYCNSPECKAWSTVKRLKRPQRFAEFVEGSSHLTDEEILAYDLESCEELDALRVSDHEDQDSEIENHDDANSFMFHENHISSSSSFLRT